MKHFFYTNFYNACTDWMMLGTRPFMYVHKEQWLFTLKRLHINVSYACINIFKKLLLANSLSVYNNANLILVGYSNYSKNSEMVLPVGCLNYTAWHKTTFALYLYVVNRKELLCSGYRMLELVCWRYREWRDCWTCVQHFQRIDRKLDSCVAGSESIKGIGLVCYRFREWTRRRTHVLQAQGVDRVLKLMCYRSREWI